MKFDEEILNPKRFAILSVLFLFKRMTEGELAKAAEVQWGSLSTHLNRLEKKGYIKRKKAITKSGVRTVVEITEYGYKKYCEEIEKLKNVINTVEDNL